MLCHSKTLKQYICVYFYYSNILMFQWLFSPPSPPSTPLSPSRKEAYKGQWSLLILVLHGSLWRAFWSCFLTWKGGTWQGYCSMLTKLIDMDLKITIKCMEHFHHVNQPWFASVKCTWYFNMFGFLPFVFQSVAAFRKNSNI